MNNFGNRLKALRTRDNMTQNQLAQRLSLTKSVISAYENGQRMPSYDVLVHIARIYKVSTDYLLGMKSKRFIDLSGLSEIQVAAIITIVKSMKNN